MKLFIVKAISKLILPPGLFLLLAIVIFILSFESKSRYGVYKYRRKFFYVCLVLLFLLVYIFSSYPGELILVKPLEDNFAPLSTADLTLKTTNRSQNAIVVLGGGAVRGTPEGVEIGETTLKRLYKGWQLYNEKGFDIVVSGGIVPGADEFPVAKAMKEVLLEWGVPAAKIIIENKSKNTWQNAVNTTSILEKSNYNRIVLVTSATHMKRAMYSFKRNWQAKIIAAPTNYILDTDMSLLDFLPNRNSLTNSLTALHEWVGLVWYSFK